MPGTRKLGKTTDQRMAMLRQQVTDFLDHGKMETTVTRAKEIKPLAEKMITLGKKNDLAAYLLPMPGIATADSVMKAPEIHRMIEAGMPLTIGMIAFFKMCLEKISLCDRPLDLANLT